MYNAKTTPIFAGMLFITSVFESVAAPTMYVPTGPSDEIVVIDLSNHTIKARIGELENAHGLSTSKNTPYLLAGSMRVAAKGETHSVSKPTAISEAEHAAHHGEGSPEDNNLMNASSFVSIVHPEHGHVMRRISVAGLTHHTAVSPDGLTGIAIHSGTGGISVIDLNAMQVVKNVQTGQWPNYAVFTADGKKLYVSNALPGTVSEIDTKQWEVIRQIKVGKEPEHMALNKVKNLLHVANKGDGTVSVIDLNNSKVIQTIAIGKQVHGVDVSKDGQWLFSTAKGEDFIRRVNLNNGQSKTAALKSAPYHLSYVSQTNKVYVSSRKSPVIWVIDPNTLALEQTINLGKGVAHQMVIRND